jgi:hypothetical protein
MIQLPAPIDLTRMCDPDNQVTCIVQYLIRRFLRLEIKGAKATLFTAELINLRIDIKHATTAPMQQTQIRIAGALTTTRSIDRNLTQQLLLGIQQLQ